MKTRREPILTQEERVALSQACGFKWSRKAGQPMPEEERPRHAPKNPPRGSNRGNAKITEDDVQEIRHLNNLLTQKKIAELFNIDPSTVSDIVRRKTWRHVP